MNKHKVFSPLPEQRTMLKARRLRESRISLRLISVFSPKRTNVESGIWVRDSTYKSTPVGNATIILSLLPVRRRGAALFLAQVLLPLFQERILPGSEMLWESLWEPPGPRPEWQKKKNRYRESKRLEIMYVCSSH